MKKSTIWILGIVMGLSFLSLIYMQVRYIEEMVRMRNEQFDGSVKRSLYSVSKHAELAETERWILKDIYDSERRDYIESAARGNDITRQSQRITITSPDGSTFSTFEVQSMTRIDSGNVKIDVPNKVNAKSIPQTSRSLAEMLKNRYIYQRASVDEVVRGIDRKSVV